MDDCLVCRVEWISSLFLIILTNNFLGLFPYIFTTTRHLTLTLTLALPLWMRFILFGWIKNTNHIFEHPVPQGTPTILIPFIVIIETISNLIRPGPLSKLQLFTLTIIVKPLNSRFDAYRQNEKIWAATYKRRFGIIYIKWKWIFFTGPLMWTKQNRRFNMDPYCWTTTINGSILKMLVSR
jgi:hypothetical protein